MLWTWSTLDHNSEGGGGDLAALFRGQEVKKPGVFSANPPSDNASLLAREAIQNSWDAAHDQAKRSGASEPKLNLHFEFKELDQSSAENLIAELGLDELRDRSIETPEVGLARIDAFSSFFEDGEPLRILSAAESGTTGMFGPWGGAQSRMYFALLTIGFTLKEDGTGGSFGYGKAGLLSSSATRTVIAYSCFDEDPREPGVTRRLLGVTYWRPHEIDGTNHTGFGRFGDQRPDGTWPFENEQADRMAESLGIEPRDPANPDGLGTTFLIIQPTVEPSHLRKAVEQNWWPALCDSDDFKIRITDFNGKSLPPRPMKDPNLRAFTRAYEIAQAGDDYDNENERFARFSTMTLPTSDRQVEVGRLGLVASPSDWSWPAEDPDGEDSVDHKSLVALIRDPNMVVEYYVASSQRPYVRGTFVADTEVNELLRQTEPPLHNAWNEDMSEGAIDDDAPKVASSIHNRIKRHVTRFSKSLRPPEPPGGHYHLTLFSKLWAEIFTEGEEDDPPPPPGPPRQISLRTTPEELVVDPDNDLRIKATTALTVGFTEHVPEEEDAIEAIISIEFRFLESGGLGTGENSRCELTIEPPRGFEEVDDNPGQFRGTVRSQPEEPQVFAIETAGYDSDYAGRFIYTAERVLDSDSEEASGSGDVRLDAVQADS